MTIKQMFDTGIHIRLYRTQSGKYSAVASNHPDVHCEGSDAWAISTQHHLSVLQALAALADKVSQKVGLSGEKVD